MMVSFAIFLASVALIITANDIPYTPGGWNFGGAMGFLAGWLMGADAVWRHFKRKRDTAVQS